MQVWDGNSCRSLLILCHPEEAESHAKRATPNEGPMQLASNFLTDARRDHRLASRCMNPCSDVEERRFGAAYQPKIKTGPQPRYLHPPLATSAPAVRIP
jgi:hypothetical protein